MIPASIAVALLSATLTLQGAATVAPPFFRLSVIVTDCYEGRPVEGSTVKVVPGNHGPVTYLRYSGERSASLTPGAYTLIAEQAGFATLAKTINLGGRDLFVSLCLNVSPIELPYHHPAGESLVGAAHNRHLLNGAAWVRLAGLYDDFSAVEPVVGGPAASGTFKFTALRPGRYMLMLFGGGGLLASKTVDVRGEQDTTVEID